MADRIVYVVDPAETTRSVLRSVREQLDQMGASVLGVVVKTSSRGRRRRTASTFSVSGTPRDRSTWRRTETARGPRRRPWRPGGRSPLPHSCRSSRRQPKPRRALRSQSSEGLTGPLGFSAAQECSLHGNPALSQIRDRMDSSAHYVRRYVGTASRTKLGQVDLPVSRTGGRIARHEQEHHAGLGEGVDATTIDTILPPTL